MAWWGQIPDAQRVTIVVAGIDLVVIVLLWPVFGMLRYCGQTKIVEYFTQEKEPSPNHSNVDQALQSWKPYFSRDHFEAGTPTVEQVYSKKAGKVWKVTWVCTDDPWHKRWAKWVVRIVATGGHWSISPWKWFAVELHELSHVIFALLCGQTSLERITLEKDYGGSTVFKKVHLKAGVRKFILVGGYIGGTIFGAMFLFMGFDSKASKVTAFILMGVTLFPGLYSCWILSKSSRGIYDSLRLKFGHDHRHHANKLPDSEDYDLMNPERLKGLREELRKQTVYTCTKVISTCVFLDFVLYFAWLAADSILLRFVVLFLGLMTCCYSIFDNIDDNMMTKAVRKEEDKSHQRRKAKAALEFYKGSDCALLARGGLSRATYRSDYVYWEGALRRRRIAWAMLILLCSLLAVMIAVCLGFTIFTKNLADQQADNAKLKPVTSNHQGTKTIEGILKFVASLISWKDTKTSIKDGVKDQVTGVASGLTSAAVAQASNAIKP